MPANIWQINWIFQMILSFHPIIEADVNILCAGRNPSKDDFDAIKKAKAVILPQGCRKSLYDMASQNCANVFPNYDALFQYPGKVGEIRLFKEMDALHPETLIFENVKAFESVEPYSFPFVFKFSFGGDGDNVHFVKNQCDLNIILNQAEKWETTGQFGFIIQKYINCGNKSLRVVVMGEKIISYWRIQEAQENFYTNTSKGAVLDHDYAPELQELAKDSLKKFCSKTKINLAGFDFLFDIDEKVPIFLEINYFFGRKGIGGSENYYRLLESVVKHWINEIP